MENIEAALSDRESGSLQKTALWDDLHVARDKAEQLEARLRRQAVEEEVWVQREHRRMRGIVLGARSFFVFRVLQYYHMDRFGYVRVSSWTVRKYCIRVSGLIRLSFLMV